MAEKVIEPIPSEDRPVDKKFNKLPFNKQLFRPPFVCRVQGMIGAGKTALAWSMLNKLYKRYYDEVIIYSGTMDSRDAWETLPQKRIIVLNEWNPTEFLQYIQQLEKDQEERKAKNKRMLNVCILFDDMIANGISKHHAGKSSPLEHLILICRHLNVSVIILTQDSKTGMTPAMRNNAMYHVLYRIQKNDLEKIAQEHAGDLTTEQFCNLYYSIINSAPHQFLIIDYKAPSHKRFRHGFSKVIKIKSNPLLNAPEEAE